MRRTLAEILVFLWNSKYLGYPGVTVYQWPDPTLGELRQD